MTINEREYFVAMRRRKNIKLRELAEYIACSISLLSKYEKYQCDISEPKENQYKKYISSDQEV